MKKLCHKENKYNKTKKKYKRRNGNSFYWPL